jgi:hypothetical protein
MYTYIHCCSHVICEFKVAFKSHPTTNKRQGADNMHAAYKRKFLCCRLRVRIGMRRVYVMMLANNSVLSMASVDWRQDTVIGCFEGFVCSFFLYSYAEKGWEILMFSDWWWPHFGLFVCCHVLDYNKLLVCRQHRIENGNNFHKHFNWNARNRCKHWSSWPKSGFRIFFFLSEFTNFFCVQVHRIGLNINALHWWKTLFFSDKDVGFKFEKSIISGTLWPRNFHKISVRRYLDMNILQCMIYAIGFANKICYFTVK